MNHEDYERLKNVLSLNVNWQEYARLYKDATGNASRASRNRLEEIGDELINFGIVSPTTGYMINCHGVCRDFIEAYHFVPAVKTKIVRKEDAEALAVALGFKKEDAIRAR